MTVSDILFMAAGILLLAAGGVGYAFAKSIERRHSRAASIMAAREKAPS